VARGDRRGSGIDSAWLQLERPDNSVVVHGALWCDGALDVAALRDRVREQWLPHYPGLSQRPVWRRGRLGPVSWRPAPPDLELHVREEKLEGDDDTALATALGEALSSSLPVDRPWWRLTVFRGGDGTSVLHVALHHGLGDGVAMNHLFHVLADGEPDPATPAAYASPPEELRGPGDIRALGHAARERRRVLGPQIREALSGRPGELRRTMRAVVRGAALLARPTRDSPTLLQETIGTRKAVRWTASLDLDAVRAAGKRDGGSVNDVLCAAVAGTLREFLGTDDGAAPRLRAVIPTNLRPMDRPVSVELGNEVGLALPSLPVDEPDPARRVARMHQTMAAVKRTDQALVTFGGIAAGGLAPPRWTQALVARYAGTSSVVISNVPGPVAELSLTGRPVTGMLFWVPCTGRLALGVSILSYAGQLRLGIAGDARVLDRAGGIDRFTELLETQLARLRS
jgi:diacylglycerol O-acyltransferase / wax synthase